MREASGKKTVVLAMGLTGGISNCVKNFDLGNSLSLLFLQKYALSDKKIREAYNIEIAMPVSMEVGEDDDFLKIVEEKKPDILGFSCFVWNIEETMRVCKRIKQSLPDVKIVLGGPEMSDPAAAMERYEQADFVITGDGEEPFKKLLLEFASKNPDYENVPALSFRKQGRNVVNTRMKILENLDDIPIVFTPRLMKSVQEEVYYISSRGCYGKCKYCSAAGHKLRYFSIERVEEELKAIFSSKSIKSLLFHDSLMNFDKQRFKDILGIIARYNKRRILCCGFVNVDRLDEETIEMMRQANFTHVWIGFESESSAILKMVGRSGTKKDTIKNYLRIERDPVFSTLFNTIYIIPGDTYSGFKKTMKTCVNSGIRSIVSSRQLVLPGTHYWKEAVAEGLQYDQHPPYFLQSCRSFTSEDLAKAEQLAINIRMILFFIYEPDRVFLLNRGIDIVDMAEDIHTLFPEWQSLYKRRSPFNSEILSHRLEISDIIGAYIELKMPNEKDAAFFRELLAVRKAQQMFKNDNLYLHVKKKESATPDMQAQVLDHLTVSFSYDYNSYIKAPEKTPPIIEPERVFCYVTLHPAKRKENVYHTRNVDKAARVLETLEKQMPETTLKTAYKNRYGFIDMKFNDYMALVQELCDNGLIGLCNKSCR